MDAQKFLAEFGHIASAPGGVQQLRDMILSLAVLGELTVAENPQSAETLLESIKSKKTKHPDQKKVVQPQPKLNRLGARAPSHWAICRLGDLVLTITGGGTPSKQNPAYWDGNIPWASVKDLKNYKYLTETEDHISEAGITKSSTNLIPPGRVIVCTRMGLGKAVINKVSVAINQDLKAFELPEEVNIDFFYILYRTRNIKGKGTTVSGIKQDHLLALPAALPPIEEQARIVAKVDELMALCDKLEAQYQEQAKIEMAARKAVLQDLVGADVVSMSGSLERLAQNLHNLFRTPDSVDDFLVSLKELAVRGLLTTAPAVIPDVDLIKRASTKLRAEYIATGWMRKQKIVLASDSTIDYPPNWAVMPFDDVAVVIGGVTKGRNLSGRDVVTCPYLSVANVQRGFFKIETVKTIDIVVGELGKYRIQEGDLLITEGGDWDKVGRTAIWRGSIENCLHQNHVFKARIPSDQLLNEWVELVFNSNIGRDYFAGASKQTTNLASINMTQLRGFALPIPTLAEQKAILGKLSTLSESCRIWRDQLVQARMLSSLLAVASVNKLTGIRSEEQETECPT